MQIILVPRNKQAPKTYDTGHVGLRARVLAIAVGAVLVVASIGAAAALAVVRPRDSAVREIQAMRQTIQQQQQQLAQVHADAQRDVNALAVKLGELQAQSVRLDALGERLAKAGKLKDGEFDFDQPPAIGGAEDSGEATYALPQTLNTSIGSLSSRFDRQQVQLKALEDLLLDRRVASSLRPTGMPISDGYISSYFGYRTDPFNGHREFHSGLDMATPIGTPVHAVAEGIVTYAGTRSGYGNVVEVDHGNGYMTRYAHNSKLLVHVGERVRVGQKLSLTGSTGRSTGPHLHFEVWYKGRAINPLAFVRSHR
ncbi:M23 family metallopeptidase [Oleiagrimonas soli]|uniref:Murein DD-endopeptidase MepM/ murein hydrolase activator NlpD n=1 Tax=Oleiagrimonas soli TaxID=1543381 RepID=A0A099CTY5_9GAMM|nr:M23 family metallopeptidase [Oleiagrimonas soli]KGI77052.1 peptidase M23 [Oleiagrimonas soli]MBB6185421.1 murein DD-endopeptidase MepM/ murein hydrolase activator NlpD [Oleiagrimonas soli]